MPFSKPNLYATSCGLAFFLIPSVLSGCWSGKQGISENNLEVMGDSRSYAPFVGTQFRLGELRIATYECFRHDKPETFEEMMEYERFRRRLEIEYGKEVNSPSEIVDYWGNPIVLYLRDGSYFLQSAGINGVYGDRDDQWRPMPVGSINSAEGEQPED